MAKTTPHHTAVTDPQTQREKLTPATSRVYAGDLLPQNWVSSAFAVATHVFMTAQHVTQDLSGKTLTLTLAGPAFDSPQRVQRIETHPQRDVALLFIDPGAPPHPHCLTVSKDGVNRGRCRPVLRFPATDQDLNLVPTTVGSYDGSASAYQATPHLAKGMSGGPVMRGDTVVGVVYARGYRQCLSLHRVCGFGAGIFAATPADRDAH